MIAQPEEFRSLARALRGRSELIHGDGKRIRDQFWGLSALWQSPAARFFISWEAPRCSKKADEVGDDLEALAHSLERLADQMEARIVEIRRIEDRTRQWFGSRAPEPDGREPIWIRDWWRYRPGHLPPRHDTEWFDVRRYLRARGAGV